MFSALDAKVAGFKVYVVMDPSGDPSEIVRREQRLPVCPGDHYCQKCVGDKRICWTQFWL
jgi:hypothetical protein